jgi:hypothetical protein
MSSRYDFADWQIAEVSTGYFPSKIAMLGIAIHTTPMGVFY